MKKRKFNNAKLIELGDMKAPLIKLAKAEDTDLKNFIQDHLRTLIKTKTK